ncbi:MAG: IS3 family transposase [Pseudomonadota bacterium]
MNQYELIETMREDEKFAVTELCEALGVSRSGFYAWKERPPSAREKENTELVAAIREIHSDRHTKVYGSPRMTEELRDRELCVGENRVARLMRQEGIRARSKRAFRPKTTVQDEDAKCRIAPNRLAELEEITAPGQALVGDITYVATREGWFYLAVVMDLFGRRILGWSLSESLATPLVSAAFKRAKRYDESLTQGTLFHSDRGCQYTSSSFLAELAKEGVISSMSAKGYCYDNATCESFFATLKNECFPEDHVFDSKTEAKRAIFDYLETFYNQRRKHSSLGYRSPDQYLQDYQNSLN